MKKLILIVITVIALGMSGAAAQQTAPGHDCEQEQEHENKSRYTCPMHPKMVTDHPGVCPKCGMKLVLMKPEKRSTLNAQRPTLNISNRSASIEALGVER
jgi:Heavy metal binding domain